MKASWQWQIKLHEQKQTSRNPCSCSAISKPLIIFNDTEQTSEMGFNLQLYVAWWELHNMLSIFFSSVLWCCLFQSVVSFSSSRFHHVVSDWYMIFCVYTCHAETRHCILNVIFCHFEITSTVGQGLRLYKNLFVIQAVRIVIKNDFSPANRSFVMRKCYAWTVKNIETPLHCSMFPVEIL